MDYKEIANRIIKDIGGSENVEMVTHCLTRLRFVVKDKKKVNMEGLKEIPAVLGAVYSTNQLQVILGKNLIPVFNEIISSYDFKVGDLVDESLDTDTEDSVGESRSIKTLGNKLLGYITGAITPQIPGLLAGSMLKVVLLLVSLIWPSVVENQTYILMNFLSSVPFYFMPLFVTYGAAKKLKANVIYPLIVVAALLYPDFITLLGSGDPVSLLSFPILTVNYANSLLPALLITPMVVQFEKIFDKIVPGVFKIVLVGMLTISVSYILAITVVGPIGIYVGNYVVGFLVFLQNTIGPFALAVLTGFLPFMIITGMHALFGPFMVQSIADLGYDGFFRPALILHNMAEGGACLGVAIRAKNKDLKAEAISCAVGCILAGVTEPAIYGITLRLKRPLYAVCASGAIGGLIAGIMGAKAFVMGYSSILALPIFQATIIAMVVAIAVTIVVSSILTIIIGFDESDFKI